MAGKDVVSGMDHKAHDNTYAGFVTASKWGTIITIIITVIVIAILVF